jgi:hypothetical protein
VTAERGLAIVMLVVSALLFSSLAGPAWRVWRIYAGTKRRRQQDAAGSAPLPPPEAAARIEALLALGFSRAGETFVDLPDTGRRFVWQLVHVDHEIYAAIVPNRAIGALVGIYSAWPDGTWLSTMHPVGETIDRAGLVVQVRPEGLGEALAAHRARGAGLRAAHGAPRRVETLADILVLDADYRTRYGGRTLVRRTTRLVLPAALGGILLVLALVLLAITAR